MLLAWGRSHRTSTEGEIVRWGADLARIEGHAGDETIEVALVRSGAEQGPGWVHRTVQAPRPRRRPGAGHASGSGSTACPGARLVSSGFSGRSSSRPRRCSSSSGRRDCDARRSTSSRRNASSAYLRDLATYSRTLQQRNSLLRAIREEQADRERAAVLGRHVPRRRQRDRRGATAPPRRPGSPARPGPRRDRPGRSGGQPARDPLRDERPGTPRRVAAGRARRRLAETAEKEVWNGSTLVGPAPRRSRLRARRAGPVRASHRAASSGPRSSPSSSPSSTSLTEQDGRPPLLLLDDVFSELDPERRAHLVRRIAELPQAFVTTTTLADLDPGARRCGHDLGGDARRRRRRAARAGADHASDDRSPPADDPDRRSAAGRGARARARGRAAAVPIDGHVRGDRRRAGPGRGRRLPGRAARRIRPRRRGGRADRRPGTAPARRASSSLRSRPRRRAPVRASSASTSGAEAPAYNPAHLPATRLRGRRSRSQPGSTSRRPAPPIDHRRLPITRELHGRPSPNEARRHRRARSRHRLAGHGCRRRAERRVRGAIEGQPLPHRHLDGREPARPGGDAARRRDDPERVLLRRVGRESASASRRRSRRRTSAWPTSAIVSDSTATA